MLLDSGLAYMFYKTGYPGIAHLLLLMLPLLLVAALRVRHQSKCPNCHVPFAFQHPEHMPDKRGFLRRQYTVFYQCHNCAYRLVVRRYRK